MDTVKEWHRLTEYYSNRATEELLELAVDFDGLTEVAQQVLRGELTKRGLPQPEDIAPERASKLDKKFGASPAKAGRRFGDSVLDPLLPTEEPNAVEAHSIKEYSWKVVLCECNEREDAADVMAALERAGIQSWYDGPGGPFSTLRYGPRVLVGADDLESARRVIEQPIPQDIRDQTRTPVPDFEVPNCTKCGATDPLLESVDPSNTWFCENCGTRWSEPIRKTQIAQ